MRSLIMSIWLPQNRPAGLRKLGRFFSHDYGNDSLSILINETAVKSLGLKDPIGKYILEPRGTQQFRRLKIIGVMKDFYIESMHKAITPG